MNVWLELSIYWCLKSTFDEMRLRTSTSTRNLASASSQIFRVSRCTVFFASHPVDRQGTVPLDQAHSSRNLVQNVDNDIHVYAQLSGCQSFLSALHASFSTSTRSITFPLTTLANHVKHIYIYTHANNTCHVVSNIPFHTSGGYSNAQALS